MLFPGPGREGPPGNIVNSEITQRFQKLAVAAVRFLTLRTHGPAHFHTISKSFYVTYVSMTIFPKAGHP
jgi:hypothetical protein